MSLDGQRLYGLLPALYRQRDDEHGAELKALIEVIAEQVAVLADNLEQLYNDQFIETCAPWVVPYIGDMIGYRAVHGVVPRVGSPRAEVAHTIGFRRRKGTAAVLEQLARDVTGCPARVVEFFQQLGTTQYMNHVRLDHWYTPNLRQAQALERLHTPFGQAAHSVEVRRIASRQGRYNIPNLGIFLWRLRPYALTNSPAFKLDDRRYLFSPLGNNTPVFTRPATEDDVTHLAEPINVPVPISRRLLYNNVTAYYGPDKSLFLRRNGVDVNATQVQAYDLSDAGNGAWAHQPSDSVAIDPVLGRIAFPQNEPPPSAVHVTFHTGFSADMGGGEYERADSFDALLQPIQPVRALATLQPALDARRPGGVVEIRDSGRYPEPLSLTVEAGQRLELRAANQHRPTLVLPGAATISGGADAEVTLNGLLITGGPLRVSAEAGNRLRRLRLRHCTLVPGWRLTHDGTPEHPDRPSLIVASPEVSVEIEHCIVGGLRVVDGAQVRIAHSIVDATSESAAAYAALDGKAAGGALQLVDSTVIGTVHTILLELASNTIFLAALAPGDTLAGPVVAQRRQAGCVRFSYLPLSAVVPRRFRCLPRTPSEATRLRPQFTSLRYGDPGYGQLAPHCAVEIRTGAEDEAEIGAFHTLYQPQRDTNLRVRLEEYLRFGLEAGILLRYVSAMDSTPRQTGRAMRRPRHPRRSEIMSGDYSRQRFEPSKHFSAVLMQQGRVQLDADWNEQGAILDRRWRAETTDLIGRCGVPRETPDGFKIVAAGDTFTMGPGRIYVDGLLVENHGQVPVTFDQVLAELRGTTAVPYAQQPYFLNPPQLLPGRHLVYLDVWQREVTALEDPTLIEPAVGTDSTARLQTVWQVKVLPNVGTDVTCTTPDADIPGWSAVLQPSTGRLSTAADGVSGVLEDPCLLPPGGGYAGVENQLYRVEIHDGGPLGLATFVWSRDNATVATQVLAMPALDRLVVDSTGRDAVLRFHIGDWVEITDDERELQGLPGEMRRLQAVDDATRTLILEQPLRAGVFTMNKPGHTDPARHTRVRRWDQHGKVLDTNGNLLVDLDDLTQSGVIPIPSSAGTSVILEHGVRIAFDTASPDGPFRTGDYWVFATRTADASVEPLEQAPARGIHHHYCRLALIEVRDDRQVTVGTDCRQIFPHGLLAITTGEVLFEAAPAGQEVVSGLIDSGLGSGPICVLLGMAQPQVQTRNPVVTLGHNAQALLTADVESPSGQFQVRAVRQGSGAPPMLIHWWAFRPERHLGRVVVAPGVSVSVAPPQPTISAGGQQQFTAKVRGSDEIRVIWSVNDIQGGNNSLGTISAAGLYRAPASVPASTTVTVKATSEADQNTSATADVTILPLVPITIEPPLARVGLAGPQQFDAKVNGVPSNRAVRWSVQGLGRISDGGLYQAPATLPNDVNEVTATVQAISLADPTKRATATVIIFQG